jgi:hypothetical protein
MFFKVNECFSKQKKKKELEFRNNQAGEAILHIRGLRVLI